MVEGGVKPKKAKKAKKVAGVPAKPQRPDDGILGWATWVTFGVVLVGGVVAWKLIGTSYKRDVGTICDAEQASGYTVEKETSKVSAWIRAHLGTPEGNELYSAITDARGPDRAKKLEDAASAQQIAPCPMVASYQEMAAQAEYRGDLQHLCSELTFPKLLASDDPTRLDMLEGWIDKSAKSPRTKALADPLRQAQSGPDRAQVLRDTAAKVDVLSCENAKTLEKPPPPKLTGAPIVRLYADPDIIGGLRPEDVKKAMTDAQAALNDCYKQGIERRPDLTGKLSIRLQIDSTGTVLKDSPGEESSIADKDTLLCIGRVTRTFKFPNVVGPIASVMLPIELTHLPE